MTAFIDHDELGRDAIYGRNDANVEGNESYVTARFRTR